MHILVTGAAGMIGRKLTARLVKDGEPERKIHRSSDIGRCGRAGETCRL